MSPKDSDPCSSASVITDEHLCHEASARLEDESTTLHHAYRGHLGDTIKYDRKDFKLDSSESYPYGCYYYTDKHDGPNMHGGIVYFNNQIAYAPPPTL